jgi:hypothetical protein
VRQIHGAKAKLNFPPTVKAAAAPVAKKHRRGRGVHGGRGARLRVLQLLHFADVLGLRTAVARGHVTVPLLPRPVAAATPATAYRWSGCEVAATSSFCKSLELRFARAGEELRFTRAGDKAGRREITERSALRSLVPFFWTSLRGLLESQQCLPPRKV